MQALRPSCGWSEWHCLILCLNISRRMTKTNWASELGWKVASRYVWGRPSRTGLVMSLKPSLNSGLVSKIWQVSSITSTGICILWASITWLCCFYKDNDPGMNLSTKDGLQAIKGLLDCCWATFGEFNPAGRGSVHGPCIAFNGFPSVTLTRKGVHKWVYAYILISWEERRMHTTSNTASLIFFLFSVCTYKLIYVVHQFTMHKAILRNKRIMDDCS